MNKLSSVLYDSLGNRQIRLLEVRAGSRDDVLDVALGLVALDEDPSFEALSYSWDNQLPSIEIQSESGRLLVTQNVFDALQTLRLPDEARNLWIDQVCINQEDLAERSAQVLLMRDIYVKAQRVLIWLGPATQDSHLAFEFLDTLATVFDFKLGRQKLRAMVRSSDWESFAALNFSDQSEECRTTLLSLPKVHSPKYRSLMGLFARTWFSRRWIIQEAALASSQSLYLCGQDMFQITNFNKAMQAFTVCGYDDSIEWGTPARNGEFASQVIGNVREMRSLGNDSRPLSNLLMSFKKSLCKDPRDIIYAILALCDDDVAQHVLIDYSRPVEDIYASVVKAAIMTYGNMEIFSALQKWPDEIPTLNLPSWTPDFSDMRSAFGLSLSARTSRSEARFYNASRSRPPKLDLNGNPRRLNLNGVRFRQIIRRIDDRISLRHVDNIIKGSRSYADWCEMYKAEASRLGLKVSCIRKHDFGGDDTGDILFHHIKGKADEIDDEVFLAVALRRTMTADSYPRRRRARFGSERIEDYFHHLKTWSLHGCPSQNIPPQLLQEHDLYVTEVMRSRTLFVAGEEPGDSFLCLSCLDVQVGDWIYVLDGADVPFVMRARGDVWEFIGECYVHGIMDGELFTGEQGQPPDEWFVIE